MFLGRTKNLKCWQTTDKPAPLELQNLALAIFSVHFQLSPTFQSLKLFPTFQLANF